MAITNGWGQGIDNAIGWGQGAANATNGWGAIEAVSWAGDTTIYEPPFAPDQWQSIYEQWQTIDRTWNEPFPYYQWNEVNQEYELINNTWN